MSLSIRLAEDAEDNIKEAARQLGFKEDEIVNMGIALMVKYARAKSKDESAALLIHANGELKELILR